MTLPVGLRETKKFAIPPAIFWIMFPVIGESSDSVGWDSSVEGVVSTGISSGATGVSSEGFSIGCSVSFSIGVSSGVIGVSVGIGFSSVWFSVSWGSIICVWFSVGVWFIVFSCVGSIYWDVVSWGVTGIDSSEDVGSEEISIISDCNLK